MIRFILDYKYQNMQKIDPLKAKRKFDEHFQEIEKLEKMDYKEADERVGQLNEKICSLINVSFDDAKEKLEQYKPNPLYAVSTGMTNEEREENSRNFTKRRLNMMKNYIVGYKEELNLILDTDKKTDELSQIGEKITKAGLESNRREEVAKSKFYGAVIELLDFQRNLLKDHEVVLKEILEIKNILNRLESNSGKIARQNTIQSEQEDIWYSELNTATEGSSLTKTVEARKQAKRLYSKIKLLKKEIAELRDTISRTSHYPTLTDLRKQFGQRKSQVDVLLKQLADLWSEYT